MLTRLPIVIFRAILASVMLTLGWTLLNFIVTSDLAKMAYIMMPGVWVIAFSTIIPMMVVMAGVVWVFLPLVQGGGGEQEQGQDSSLIKRLFGMG